MSARRRRNPRGEVPVWPFVLGGTVVVGIVGVLLYRRLGESTQATQHATQAVAPLTGLADTANQVLGTAAQTASGVLR